jgi:hypothetical protein
METYEDIVHSSDYYPATRSSGERYSKCCERAEFLRSRQIGVMILKKEEFMLLIEGCKLPEMFDQNLLDNASVMFSKWGLTTQMDEKEYLFKSSGLAPKTEDSNALKKEKESLRCVCEKMMDSNLNRKDAATIIKNFNNIIDPGARWIED